MTDPGGSVSCRVATQNNGQIQLKHSAFLIIFNKNTCNKFPNPTRHTFNSTAMVYYVIISVRHASMLHPVIKSAWWCGVVQHGHVVVGVVVFDGCTMRWCTRGPFIGPEGRQKVPRHRCDTQHATHILNYRSVLMGY